MKRIVLFWIPLLLLLLVNCTTESFDFGDQEGILVGRFGRWRKQSAQPDDSRGIGRFIGIYNRF